MHIERMRFKIRARRKTEGRETMKVNGKGGRQGTALRKQKKGPRKHKD